MWIMLRSFVATHRAAILQAVYIVALFVAMVVGMVAKAFYDNIVKNERPPSVNWALFLRPEIALPLIVSPMIFGAIYGFLKDNPSNIGALIFAFQNGFFWKTIFGGLESPTAFVR